MNKSPGNLQKLISSVKILSVRLVEANVKSTIRSVQEAGEVTVGHRIKSEVRTPAKEGKFYVTATIETRITPRRSRGKSAVSVSAVYELCYKITTGKRFSHEDLIAFGEVNGVFNAWPYWREFIQSTMARMNLPPVMLPVFRLNDILEAKHGATDQIAKEA